jgi:hypothetical protein
MYSSRSWLFPDEKVSCERFLNACSTGDLIAVNRFIEPRSDSDINISDPDNGNTGLMLASAANYGYIMTALLEKRSIKANATNLAGDTALMMAAERGHTNSVFVLLNHLNLEQISYKNHGYDALAKAERGGHREAADLIRRHISYLTRPAATASHSSSSSSAAEAKAAHQRAIPAVQPVSASSSKAAVEEKTPSQPVASAKIETPNQYLCPISSELMTDPVAMSSGQVYERREIEKWFKAKNKNKVPCPITHIELDISELRTNQTCIPMARLINRFNSDPKKGQAAIDHPEYHCPISGGLMEDPVITSHGHAYERQALKNLFEVMGTNTVTLDCPISGMPLTLNISELTKPTCFALKSLIEQFKASQKNAPAKAATPVTSTQNSSSSLAQEEEKVREPDAQYEDTLVPMSSSASSARTSTTYQTSAATVSAPAEVDPRRVAGRRRWEMFSSQRQIDAAAASSQSNAANRQTGMKR